MILLSEPTFKYKRLYSKSWKLYLAFKLLLFFTRESRYKALGHLYEATMDIGFLLRFQQDEDVLKILSEHRKRNYFKIDLTLFSWLHEKKARKVLNPLVILLINECLHEFLLINLKMHLFFLLKSWNVMADHYF